uniref:AKNA domain-containing protein n=1 Tax=Pelodiscus sinensis TaxID=13735 RepID=K7FHR5_PELSI
TDNFDYPEDATEEEQEDLPYDGDLKKPSHHNNESKMNRNLNEEINYKTQYLPQEKVFSHCTSATRTNEITTEKAIEAPVCGTSLEMELSVGACRIPDRKEHFINSKISDLLLHHFSKEELSNTSQLIDCETIPELSFAESVDETVLTKTRISECTKATFLTEQWAKHFEDDCLNIQEEIYQDDCKYKHLLDDNKCVIDDRATSYGEERDCIQENSQLTAENEDANNFQNIRKNHTNQKGLFERTGSSHELKYGQGQVNYCLPDFSKVASKVKIPKRNNNDKSAPKMKRTKFSPNLVGKSAIVKDVLETMNYFDSVKVKNQEEEGMKIPELLQQIEVNSPNPNLSIHSRCYIGLQDGRMISSLPSATAAGEIHCSNPNSMENTTKGEKMSQMLKEQAEQLKTKVEEFSKCVIQETLPLQDRCLALQELKGCLDTLERNYLATKEKHRGLQLQNYNHKSTSIGKFDPDRKLEGEIFRLGMLLEDVKEKIDDNRCSPYPS